MLDAVIQGDTVREVLDYVQFKSHDAGRTVPQDVEAALREGRIGYEESAGCCGSTKRACTATRTWKTPPSTRRMSASRAGGFSDAGFLPGILRFDRTGRFYGSDPLAGEFPYLLLLIELWFLRHNEMCLSGW